jgi:hypothetical protein
MIHKTVTLQEQQTCPFPNPIVLSVLILSLANRDRLYRVHRFSTR